MYGRTGPRSKKPSRLTVNYEEADREGKEKRTLASSKPEGKLTVESQQGHVLHMCYVVKSLENLLITYISLVISHSMAHDERRTGTPVTADANTYNYILQLKPAM